jgi:hypothetical protein
VVSEFPFMNAYMKRPARVIRAVLRRLGFDIVRYRRQEIAALTGNVVKAGLFAGLILPNEQSWAPDLAAKLLGLYENELESALSYAARTEPDLVINVGCAEGFYALGLAKLIPNAKVIAYDIDPKAQRICGVGRELNNLTERVEIRGSCSADELQRITKSFKRPFAMIDCEGNERQLLLSNNYTYANTSMIVECHDFLDREITSDLVNKFSRTHSIELIKQGAKNPFTCEITKGWPENDLWLIVSEGRPEAMHWLNLRPLVDAQDQAPASETSKPGREPDKTRILGTQFDLTTPPFCGVVAVCCGSGLMTTLGRLVAAVPR